MDGAAKDDPQAVARWRKAAGQGDADAQWSLGKMYANGQGGAPDDAQAATGRRHAPEPELLPPGDDPPDPLYGQAVQLARETGNASTSFMQRRLKIGYHRAVRLLDAMERAGLVSGMGGDGKREVLAPSPPAGEARTR